MVNLVFVKTLNIKGYTALCMLAILEVAFELRSLISISLNFVLIVVIIANVLVVFISFRAKVLYSITKASIITRADHKALDKLNSFA